jgi:hypothetical protein
LANGEIDPLRSRRELNLGGAGLNDTNLVLGSDTRVEENAWSRVCARREDDRTTLAQLNNLARAILMFDFDTGNDGTLANNTEDLGVKLKAEVVECLCIRENVPNGTTTKPIADLHRVSFNC